MNPTEAELRYECINAGISGLTSPKLLEIYRDEWIEWQPDLVVGNNDDHIAPFRASLESFASLNQARGIEESNTIRNRERK